MLVPRCLAVNQLLFPTKLWMRRKKNTKRKSQTNFQLQDKNPVDGRKWSSHFPPVCCSSLFAWHTPQVQIFEASINGGQKRCFCLWGEQFKRWCAFARHFVRVAGKRSLRCRATCILTRCIASSYSWTAIRGPTFPCRFVFKNDKMTYHLCIKNDIPLMC